MKTILVMVGKTTDNRISVLFDEYLDRLTHYNIGFQTITIPDPKNSSHLPVERQKQMEGNAILKIIQSGDYVVLLDEKGKEFTSKEMAKWFEKQLHSSVKRIIFVIGGPFGFSQEVYKRSDAKLSLSKLTFSHQMVRLFFVEQLYRSMTIINGEKYHHD